jgi:hypothetical protein
VSAPEGWDDEIPEAMLAGAREIRSLYVALIAVGFTTSEAAVIIAHFIVANNSANPAAGSPS